MHKKRRYKRKAAFNSAAEFKQIYSEVHQRLTGSSGPIIQGCDDDMFRQKLIRIKTPRFFLGIQGQYTLYPLG